MAFVNTATGRRAYTGPAGQPGYPITSPAQASAGQMVWTQPDGQLVAYNPSAPPDSGNVGALLSAGYSVAGAQPVQVRTAPSYTGPAPLPIPTQSVGTPPRPAYQPPTPTVAPPPPAAPVAPVYDPLKDPAYIASQQRAQQSASAYISGLLSTFGLGSLSGFANNLIKQGVLDPDYIVQQIRGTSEYKQRFKAIVQQQQLAAQGKTVQVMSEGELISYENTLKTLMQRANLPTGFYDSPDDFTNFAVKGVSAAEVQSRIEDGYQRVVMAPPEVRQFYENTYGVHGDAALAATFIDPDRAEATLLRQVAAAEIGGTAARSGFQFGQQQAEGYAARGITGAQTEAALAQVNQLNPLWQETASESTDLTAQGTGVKAFLEGDAASIAATQRRQQTRQSAFEGGGGAAANNRGFALGAAQ